MAQSERKPKQSFLSKLSPFSHHQKREAAAPRLVRVQRVNGTFGFSVKGGVENDLLPSIILGPEVTCSCLVGQLKMGDEIVTVNGENVAGEAHEKVVALIRKSGDIIDLEVISAPKTDSRKLSRLLNENSKNTAAISQSIVSRIRSAMYDYAPPVTSRPKRPDEEEGREYHFVTKEEFEQLIRDNDLVEYGVNEDNNHYYGTMRLSYEAIYSRHAALPTRLQHVTIQKAKKGEWGFTLGGGLEDSQLPYVVSVDGQPDIQVNDTILAINKVYSSGMTLDDANMALSQADKEVELVLLRNARGVTLDEVVADNSDEQVNAFKADMIMQLFDPSVPFTTRKRREIEVEGIDYNFVTPEVFLCLQSQGKFVDSSEKDGVFYGTCTPRSVKRPETPSGISNNSLQNGARTGPSSLNVTRSPSTNNLQEPQQAPQPPASALKAFDAGSGLGSNAQILAKLTRPNKNTPFGLTFARNDAGLLVIASIAPNSPASLAKQLAPGLLVNSINNVSVEKASPSDVETLLNVSNEATVKVTRSMTRRATAAALFPGRLQTSEVGGEVSRTKSAETTRTADWNVKMIVLMWVLAVIAVLAALYFR